MGLMFIDMYLISCIVHETIDISDYPRLRFKFIMAGIV